LNRVATILAVIFCFSTVAMAGDDDDDGDQGCNKGCTVGSVPPLTPTTYRASLPSPPRFADVCAGKPAFTAEPQDGFGGEVLARIAARSSAMEHGYVYVHTPFVQLDHVGGQEDYMERFLNLGADEIDIRNITGDFNVLRHKNFDWNSGLGASGCNLIHACTNSGGCMGDKGISHTIGGSMDDLRARYRRGEPKPALPFQEGAYNVAVHLRRGDVEHKVASEQELLLTIARVRETVAEEAGTRPVQFHVFTQGAPGSLPLMANETDITLHIDSNTVQHGSGTIEVATALQVAYHSFVMADALIITSSALGYSAAFFSEGRVFAYNHPRPRRSDWTMVQDDGNFTAEQAALSARPIPPPAPQAPDRLPSFSGLGATATEIKETTLGPVVGLALSLGAACLLGGIAVTLMGMYAANSRKKSGAVEDALALVKCQAQQPVWKAADEESAHAPVEMEKLLSQHFGQA